MKKTIFYISFCILLSAISGYVGFALKVALTFNVVKEYPAIVVGLVAAAAALLGVIISQIGQYSLTKFTQNSKDKLIHQETIENAFLSIYKLEYQLKELVESGVIYYTNSCNYLTYMASNSKSFDLDDKHQLLLKERNTAKSIYRESTKDFVGIFSQVQFLFSKNFYNSDLLNRYKSSIMIIQNTLSVIDEEFSALRNEFNTQGMDPEKGVILFHKIMGDSKDMLDMIKKDFIDKDKIIKS